MIKLTIENYAAEIAGADDNDKVLSSGACWHEGWEIPTLWAVTSRPGSRHAMITCHMNSAHGDTLQVCTTQVLLNVLGKTPAGDNLRSALGMKPALPDWMQTALKTGWTPPATFNQSDFDG